MGTPLQAQQLVSLAPAEADLGLLIEPDPNGAADLDVHLLLFPAVDASLAASAGSVRRGITKTVDVPPGIVTFSGGETVQLPKIPSGTAPTFRVLYSFNTTGQPTPISVALDSLTGELRANTPCYAAVAYTTYRTRALELIYTPLIEQFGQGSRTTFGVIAAFYPPRSQTIYQVQALDLDEGDVKYELYRVISYAVSNSEGEFEFPPSYPASGAYPDSGFVFDTSNSLQTERVHEIGYVNKRGHTWITPYHVPIKEPYVGVSAYAPKKYFRKNQVPEDLFEKSVIEKANNFVAKQGLGYQGLASA